MYNLSPRMPNMATRGTPANVGPNSYIICDRDHSLKNRVPFLSETERNCGSSRQLYTHAIYGPFPDERIKGGASVKYTDIRDRYKDSGTPGPAEYSPKVPHRGCKYVEPPCHGTGRLYVCRVPYAITISAPSIPTEINENGYDIDINNDIVAVPPDFHDRTRGPAYYCVPTGEMFYTRKRYRGCNWSKSKTQRSPTVKWSTPAPGAYNIGDANACRKCDKDEEYRGLARLLTFIPRYTEAQMLKAEREGLPGPGTYDVKSCNHCRESLSINPRPLISGAARFKTLQSDNPGPGEYDVCYGDKEPRQFSTADVPFGFDALRFPDKKGFETPSPATYNIKGSMEEKFSCKCNLYGSVDVPFACTGERKMGAFPNGVPGPDVYPAEEKPEEKLPIYASVFKSRTSRFSDKCPTAEDFAPIYNVTEAFNKNHNRTSTNAGKVPFLTSGKRAPKFKTDTPGPSDYLGQTEVQSKGATISTTSRFKDLTSDVPPPGYYTVHPMYDLSIYKAIGTHNLRLKENVLRKKLRVHPAVTWAAWAANIKKKRKLKWFEEPKIGGC